MGADKGVQFRRPVYGKDLGHTEFLLFETRPSCAPRSPVFCRLPPFIRRL
jgi:hypothetical protein